MAKRKTRSATAAVGTRTGAPTIEDRIKELVNCHGTDWWSGGTGTSDRTLDAPSVVPWDGADVEAHSAAGKRRVGLGWRPDLPDRRDWRMDAKGTVCDPRCQTHDHGKKLQLELGGDLPERYLDNIEFCSPVEDQEALGSCTAQAVVGMMEYMMRRRGLPHVDMSRLFLYKVTRKLLGWTGDTGAYLRSAMQAVAAFGVAPEPYWPYDVNRFDEEPEAFLYSFAANYQALQYARIDPPDSSGHDTLNLVKLLLYNGFVSVFGFSVYSSLQSGPDIPYPTDEDRLVGGHAVAAIGYDDDRQIGEYTGALLIRNSWGTWWGAGGYGWLPYAYVEDGLATDFWSIFKQEWLRTDQFQ